MTDQLPYWIALSKVPGIGPARMRLLLAFFDNAQDAWNASIESLFMAGLYARTAEALRAAHHTANLDTELEGLDKLGARALTWESDTYPKRLREVDDAPPVLYVLGELTEADDWAVGVVGTR